MPPLPLDEPTRRVSMNLFESDVQWLTHHYTNWSPYIRALVRKFVLEQKSKEFTERLKDDGSTL